VIGQAEVLRDVQMQDVPLTLQRPRSSAADVFGGSAQTTDTPTSSPAPVAEERSANASMLREERKDAETLAIALREGRDTGYQAGHLLGVQDGYQQGLRQGQERAENDLAEALKKLRREHQEATSARLSKVDGLVRGLPKQWELFISGSEDDMVALAFEACCRILGGKTVSREDVRLQVKHVLSSWRGRTTLEVHVNPDDLQWLQEDADFAAQLQSLGHDGLRWVGNEQVEWGGCLLRSSEGGLDARLEVQLQQLRTTLLSVRAQRRAESSGT
jgi:flagellar assembly protein FliH